ncbi:MAG TPA: lipopolysaccharide kinase InaA family protein, partial [Methylophilaceae bacterium]|nr:lipopolysaccharide kinase InaA family protein [Methylophilaceae bacterium]
AYLLRFYGIATAEPVALVERRFGWVRRQSYFIAARVPGMPVAEALAGASCQQREQIAGQLAQLLYKLYLLRVEHGDMKASNLLLADGKPVLLDLDAMRQLGCGWRFKARHARDLRRFLKNWENTPDTRQLLEAALREQYRGEAVLAMAGISI